MPVTAKLSRKFYETFGDDLANELVTWFNDVDATYRSDLRELNELNFARVRAEMDSKLAALEARLDQRVSALEARFEQRLAEVKFDLKEELHRGFAGLETRLTRWTLLLWIGQAATTVGLVFGVVKLVGH